MYESLKEMCFIPVSIYSYQSTNAAGDDIYSSGSVSNGYIVEEMKLIKDKRGNDYISATRIYFPATVNIVDKDLVSYNGSRREIKKLDTYYDGFLKEASIRVVYL